MDAKKTTPLRNETPDDPFQRIWRRDAAPIVVTPVGRQKPATEAAPAVQTQKPAGPAKAAAAPVKTGVTQVKTSAVKSNPAAAEAHASAVQVRTSVTQVRAPISAPPAAGEMPPAQSAVMSTAGGIQIRPVRDVIIIRPGGLFPEEFSDSYENSDFLPLTRYEPAPGDSLPTVPPPESAPLPPVIPPEVTPLPDTQVTNGMPPVPSGAQIPVSGYLRERPATILPAPARTETGAALPEENPAPVPVPRDLELLREDALSESFLSRRAMAALLREREMAEPLNGAPGADPLANGFERNFEELLPSMVRREVSGWQYYRNLAQRADEGLYSIFETMASEAWRCAKRLAAAYFLSTGQRYWPEQSERLVLPTYLAALRERFHAELQNAARYRAAAQNCEEEYLCDIFAEANDLSQSHARQLQLLVEEA